MKYLKVDEQTIADLSIFSKQGKPSVYELFNKTKTQGGAAKLEKMFRQPLADELLINERSALYRFFSMHELAFPVDSTTISTVRYYLENDDARTQIDASLQSIGQRLKDLVSADADQVFVQDGVQASLRLFYALQQFVQQAGQVISGSAYEGDFVYLSALISSAAFSLVRQHCNSKLEVKLSVSVLSELDLALRFTHREKLLELLELLYALDVYMAVGKVAHQRQFTFARALPKETGLLNYRQVYHPHVDKAVPNDLYLDAGYNVLFLTGANMAGKSTLMKSIGIALYLAHLGFPVAAAQFEFAVRDGLFTSINLADNLQAGASHYYAEVLRVKEVALELRDGKALFVIFDELFRGTNVKDAYDATLALTAAFSKKKNSQFIISTHIMEAGEVLRQKPLSIKYQYLPTEMVNHAPVYPRVLKEGITADRHGMIIIQNEGILEMLDAGIQQNEKTYEFHHR